MNRLVLLVLFSISILIVTAQQEIDPNGYNKFYYTNGQVSSEGSMRDGKPDGYWKTYFENGELKSEGNRKDFKLDSTWVFYSDSGKVAVQINYKLGKKNGIRRTFYEDGIVEENFVDDVKEGYTYSYFLNGKTRKEVNFINGLESGIGKEFSPDDGRVVKLIYFKKGFTVDIEHINRIDRAGLKQGKWKYFYENGNVKLEGEYKNDLKNGYFKYYTEDGNLVSTEKYMDGILQENVAELAKLDIKTEYYPSGKVKIVASYNDDVPEGVRREYSEEGEIVKGYVFSKGKLIGEGITNEEGKRDGPWKEYYLNGALRSEGAYDDGKRVGDWKFYHSNGQLEQVGSYTRDGKEDGIWTWYYPDGQMLREEGYYLGMLDGPSVEYDEFGQIVSEGEYIEDYREGLWKFNYGDFREEGEYLNGMRHGQWKSYYPDGTVSFEGKFIDDNPNGKHTWYWPNGNKKTEGNFIMGLKDGEWIKYSSDGKTFISIYYKNGIEKRYDGVKVKIYDEDDSPVVPEDDY